MPGPTAIIIPALNEERALPLVLADLAAALDGLVIVVDNGSTDRTVAIARAAGAVVVDEPQRGYGAACLAGIRHLAKLPQPPDVVVILDADHSDDPACLPEHFVHPIRAGRADLVLSTRNHAGTERGSMSAVQRGGNRLQVALLRARFGLRLTDMGPLRAISFPALLALGMEDRTWGWNVEMACKAARAGLRVVEVPVPYRSRVGQSKISGTVSGVVRVGGKILYAFAKHGR